MSGWEAGERGASGGIAVDETRVPPTGWISIELDPARLSRDLSAESADRLGEPRLGDAQPGPGARLPCETGGRVGPAWLARASSRLGRVPDEAIVSIGPGRVALPVLTLPPPKRTANDNAPPSRRGRPFWRDLFFLVLLAATVAGAFFSGRLHAMQRVIVVPDAPSSRSVIT